MCAITHSTTTSICKWSKERRGANVSYQTSTETFFPSNPPVIRPSFGQRTSCTVLPSEHDGKFHSLPLTICLFIYTLFNDAFSVTQEYFASYERMIDELEGIWRKRSLPNLRYCPHVRFKVLTAASMMFRAVFWVILPCKMTVDRRFIGAYCLHHQGLLIPDDGGSTHLWNVGRQSFYMAV
jgi:hypothetical protein